MGAHGKKRGCMQSIWIGWIRICRIINDFIERLFEYHTRFITTHHTLVIWLSISFVILMAIGGWRFKALVRNEELFIPQGSQAFDDLDKGEKYFQVKYRVEEFIVKYRDNRNVFDTNQAFEKTLELHNKIIAIDKFNESCLRNPSGECEFVSSVEVFNYDNTIITAANTTEKIIAQLNSYYLNSTRLLLNGRPANLNFPNIFGQFKASTSGNVSVISSNAVRMTYFLKYVDTSDDTYDMINGWEDKYISLCKDTVDVFKTQGVELFYFAARTRDDAILESTIGDLPLFSVAFILMVLFCLFVFLRIKDPVAGHLTVGIMGICVIMAGVIAGFGLAMWVGTDFVAFTGILMFLILGIGMDNMFIIVDAMQSVDSDIQGPERLVIAMKHVGGSITMTTTTDLVAFAVSTVSEFPGVHLFCVYAALSIFFAYAMLITLFVALLTWDINRMEAGKRDVCACCSVDGYNENPWKSDYVSLTEKMLVKWGKLLMTAPMKVIVFLAACGLLAASAYGTSQITQKFEWKKLGPDGSYFRKFAAARDDNFPAGYDVSIIMPTPTAYTTNKSRQDVVDLDMIARDNTRYETMTVNWMGAYLKWGNDPSRSTYFNFMENVTVFLNENPMYKIDVNYNNMTKKIDSSRVVFFYENDTDAINQAEAMKTIRTDLKKKSTIQGIFPISIMFIYAEQFAAVVDATVLNLSICAGAILIITLPYLTHPGITGLVFLSFTSLLFELFALMTAWDVSLDVIAMTIIIMAIGFSVDYTCHIAHAFMISKKDTPELRVIDALQTMGKSVLNGGISTFLGAIITAFSQAEGFRIFFKMVFGIVVLGLIHGLIFLPVLLSIFIRRDMREDMKEFIDAHDKKEKRRSVRRMSSMSEVQKRKESISYRQGLESTYEVDEIANGKTKSTEDVELKNVRHLETLPEEKNGNGTANATYEP